MKSFTKLLIVLLTISFGTVQAQNLMVNGDLESWTAGVPDGWGLVQSITQGTAFVHGGNYSAMQTSTSTSQKFNQEIAGLQAGQEYTISYWYYDNDPMARTRIWSYWLSGGATLPDNADELRPSTYSTDDPNWHEFNVILTAPAGADAFRFEVRVYQENSQSGGAVYYDDFEFTGDIVVDPEPSNYPTNFTATAAGLMVDLAWTDATGAQLPSGYIIMAGTNSSLPVPVDGTPVANDPDLSDGSGAINVAYGVQTTAFSNLESNTPYYFTIYPYTNSGANIDYKTDGTAPSANATTADISVIESENFDDSWGNWSTISVVGDQVWDRNNTFGINSTACARISGYTTQAFDNDDWLISPAMNFNDYSNESLVFFNAKNYTGPDLECVVSTDYDGGGDPTSATWTTLTYTMCPGNWVWTNSGAVDLSAYDGSAVYVAFHYTCNTTESATWEIDDIVITGEGSGTIYPEPSNYPTSFTADPGSTSIQLAWTDATGTQLPSKYIIMAGTSSSLPVPVDGTPTPNDLDLSDGSGTMNVNYGVEDATFENLEPGVTYYFTIYPYTNSGANIDYKTDGVAPSANTTTTLTPEPSNYPTNFAATPFSSSILLSWMDATGSQLPENYIILAGTSSSLPVPVDGTPIADDLDLSDGSGAYNVMFGVEQATFEGLEINTPYYFVIYPYTNTGSVIDYKNDGTAPTTNATTTFLPEPSNYPTNFAGNPTNSSVSLSWTDATGAQLPEMYIIFAGTASSLPVPVDGTPVADDTDLSDGSGVLNIAYGVESASFNALEANTLYYFSIYSYTNSGTGIDYKTDGTAPTVSVTTITPTIVTIESENFDDSWGNWTTVSVTGDQVWSRDNTFGINNTACALMSGFSGQSFENDDWLISPPLNLDGYNAEVLTFQNAKNYTGNDLVLKVSSDYSGTGDPYSATWTTLSYTMCPGNWTWTPSGNVDLSNITGSAVYVAFQFTSTDTESATWEVDDVVITGEENMSITNQSSLSSLLKIYPNPARDMINLEKLYEGFDKIQIISLTGNVLSEINFDESIVRYDISGLNKGIYFVRFMDSATGESGTQKLIVH